MIEHEPECPLYLPTWQTAWEDCTCSDIDDQEPTDAEIGNYGIPRYYA